MEENNKIWNWFEDASILTKKFIGSEYANIIDGIIREVNIIKENANLSHVYYTGKKYISFSGKIGNVFVVKINYRNQTILRQDFLSMEEITPEEKDKVWISILHHLSLRGIQSLLNECESGR